MSSNFDFDEIFRDISKMMRKLLDLDDLERVITEGEFKGDWEVEQIDGPDVKGCVARGRFGSDQPLEPLDPFEPPIRRRRPPTPERFEVSEDALKEVDEPLVDIFEGENGVKVYIELPGEAKDEEVQLNVTDGGVEVKTGGFYKRIRVPADIDIERASSKRKNRVLEVTIPKRGKPLKSETHRITIE